MSNDGGHAPRTGRRSAGAAFWTTFEQLLGMLERRLPEREYGLFTEMWLDEEGLVIDMMAAVLTDDQVPVSACERDMIASLMRHFDLDRVPVAGFPRLHDRERVIASLNVVG